MATEGIIFNIKRFSVHDGPGIRTTIFLKGCPLSCTWCHNPEGISRDISIWYNRNTCITCGECVRVCPNKSLSLDKERFNFITIDRLLCRVTGDCVTICPTGSIDFTGRRITTGEIIEEIRKDSVFYETSGGGVTLSGGEPLFQPDFCLDILRECRRENFDTTVETCLFCDREVIESIAPYVDHFLVDLKIFDPVSHLEYTGKKNDIIFENFIFLAGMGKEVTVRIPLIEALTDSESNLENIRNFVNKINPGIPVEYLDFNPLTRSKYQKLDIPFR